MRFMHIFASYSLFSRSSAVRTLAQAFERITRRSSPVFITASYTIWPQTVCLPRIWLPQKTP